MSKAAEKPLVGATSRRPERPQTSRGTQGATLTNFELALDPPDAKQTLLGLKRERSPSVVSETLRTSIVHSLSFAGGLRRRGITDIARNKSPAPACHVHRSSSAGNVECHLRMVRRACRYVVGS